MIINTQGQARTCPLKQMDTMDNITQYLTTRYIARDIRYYEEVTSTNTAAKEAREAENGTLFIAGTQTAGRGRLGRGWSSPAGTGIWRTCLTGDFHASANSSTDIIRRTCSTDMYTGATQAGISPVRSFIRPVHRSLMPAGTAWWTYRPASTRKQERQALSCMIWS